MSLPDPVSMPSVGYLSSGDPGWAARVATFGEVSTVRPHERQDILGQVSKTSVEVDREIARQAAEILGTTTLRDTIDAALHEIVDARRRLELVALLSEEGRFDFEAAESAWGGRSVEPDVDWVNLSEYPPIASMPSGPSPSDRPPTAEGGWGGCDGRGSRGRGGG